MSNNQENANNNGSPLSGSERAALLLLMLGEDRAAEVLRHVGSDEVEKIGAAMATVDGVDKQRVVQVFDVFADEMQAQTPLGIGVPGYMRKMLVSSMGEDKGSTLADKLLGDEETLEIDSLQWMEEDMVVQILKDEHPQIIAITLAHLDQKLASRILSRLSEELQEDILYRIATMEKVPKAALQHLQKTLKSKLSLAPKLKSKSIEGAATAANIINFMGTDTSARVMETLASHDEELSNKIRELMFVFSNLVDIDDKGMQMMLREVSTDLLSVALKGADQGVRQKVFNNMSKRASEMLQEDMEVKGPIKISEVEEAQKQILEIAQRLAEEGVINLGTGGDDFVE